MPLFLSSARAVISRFCRDRSGNFAVIFGVALGPMLLAAGGAIDYAAMQRARTMIDGAADSAALEAAREAAERFRANAPNWNAAGVTAGKRTFGGAAPSGRSDIVINTPSVSVVKNGQVVTATVTYTGHIKTRFLKVAAIPALNVVHTVTSSVTVASYTDLQVVIDTSTSMGMAATLADQTAIQTKLGTTCFVACHINAFPGADTVASYRAAGATLRIDVLKQAVIAAISTLNAKSAPGTIRVAIYTFNNTLTPVFALSSNLGAAIAAVNAIDLATDGGGTNITYALQSLLPMLPAPGTGTNPTNPKGSVLLFTDGVQDHEQYHPASGWTNDPNWVPYAPSVYNQWDYQPIDPGACAPIKAKGYSFLVLNVQYLISASDLAVQTRYGDINNVVMPALPGAILGCSSGPGYSYSANTPAQISTAVTSMFVSAANSNARLTN
jgi:Flp pilus assembly protein TadG